MCEIEKRIIDDLNNKYSCALVTGGAGFIGSHICEELLNNTKLKVISLDNYSAGKRENVKPFLPNENFVEIEADITDEEMLGKIFSEHNVDIVFNNAASKKNICLKDPKKDLDVNGKGALIMLEVARKYNVKKFIHASTGSVYGEAQYFPQDEKHPLNPVSYYGVSKLAGEKYVGLYNHLYDMNTTVLRYFHVYGTRQESNEFGGVVAIFLRNMKNGENPIVHGDGTQERSFTYVKDVVKANLTVAVDDSAKGEVYNCASGIKVTINELCDQILEASGKYHTLRKKYEDWLIGDIKVFNVSNEKISNLGLTFNKDFSGTIDIMVKNYFGL